MAKPKRTSKVINLKNQSKISSFFQSQPSSAGKSQYFNTEDHSNLKKAFSFPNQSSGSKQDISAFISNAGISNSEDNLVRFVEYSDSETTSKRIKTYESPTKLPKETISKIVELNKFPEKPFKEKYVNLFEDNQIIPDTPDQIKPKNKLRLGKTSTCLLRTAKIYRANSKSETCKNGTDLISTRCNSRTANESSSSNHTSECGSLKRKLLIVKHENILSKEGVSNSKIADRPLIEDIQNLHSVKPLLVTSPFSLKLGTSAKFNLKCSNNFTSIKKQDSQPESLELNDETGENFEPQHPPNLKWDCLPSLITENTVCTIFEDFESASFLTFASDQYSGENYNTNKREIEGSNLNCESELEIKKCLNESKSNNTLQIINKNNNDGSEHYETPTWTHLDSKLEHENINSDANQLIPITETFENLCSSWNCDASRKSFINVPCHQFGRHKVVKVTYDRQNGQLLLDLSNEMNEVMRKCILKGFWQDSLVEPGDIVNILGKFDDNQTCHITDQQNLIIINPDLLISGTTVVSSLYCMRRTVLNEKFTNGDKNCFMLYGNIIHRVFQEVLQSQSFQKEQIVQIAQCLIQNVRTLQEIYAIGESESRVMEEVFSYLPSIQTWINKHMASSEDFCDSVEPELVITDIVDIEETLWSPRFGIKGKVDLTVQVKINQKENTNVTKKIMPLELKTGNASFSAEHKGQVTLYSMMMSDYRPDPEEGLLLYLKQPYNMSTIAANHNNKRGLVQIRNELVYYIKKSLELYPDQQKYKFAKLPEPINNPRVCNRCPQLLNCAIYQRAVEKSKVEPSHAMAALVPETLKHLSESHLQYFHHWCLLLHLEKKTVKKGIEMNKIWCSSSYERELNGSCFSGMVLSSVNRNVRSVESNYFTQIFVRSSCHSRKEQSLQEVPFSVRDSVVVSTETGRQIGLAQGYISKITFSEVELLLDKNLHEHKTLKDAVFRIDRCDTFKSMAMSFNNLSSLMANNPSSEKLRHLVIDKVTPTFRTALEKDHVKKGKYILKPLNKLQQKAILKCLMCRDFLLLKGIPGSGKTSTIVALIHILSLLGHSVLLTSYTHSAVDNILLKLIEYEVNFVRVGHLERIHPTLHSYSLEYLERKCLSIDQLTEFYASQSVIATTCLGINHVIFSRKTFDYVIVDEASQILQLACIGPLFLAKKFILVGDDQQLSPLVQDNDARDLGMDESLFQRLDCKEGIIELTVQYRMNSEIMRLSNVIVYNGKLKCGSEEIANAYIELPHLHPLVFAKVWLQKALSQDLLSSVVFLDTELISAPEIQDGKGTIQNEVEAILVRQIAVALQQCGLCCSDLGIIAPYRSQVKLIKEYLLEVSLAEIEVNTVDQYQGRDKSVIVVSFVRSSDRPIISENKGLLNDLRRLNVAITRAKHKLILLGHKRTLQTFGPCGQLFSILRPEQIVVLPKERHKDEIADSSNF